MDLIQTQRATVAEHLGLENEKKWSEVPLTLVQDERAFYDFTATHTGGYLGVPAGGNRAHIVFAAFFVFDHASGGERLYLDHGTLIQQLQTKKTVIAGQSQR